MTHKRCFNTSLLVMEGLRSDSQETVSRAEICLWEVYWEEFCRTPWRGCGRQAVPREEWTYDAVSAEASAGPIQHSVAVMLQAEARGPTSESCSYQTQLWMGRLPAQEV